MFQREWVLNAIRSGHFRTVRRRFLAFGLAAEHIREACRNERCAVEEALGVPPDGAVVAGVGDTLGSCAAKPPSFGTNGSEHARRVRRGRSTASTAARSQAPARHSDSRPVKVRNSARITRSATWPTTRPSTGSAEKAAAG